ncbi:hypothetical protein [uncultured Tateyamaria sp.]|uniref:hypothetical protein n=1 Tax=uncultured Tateyamaria sp. TaxID=455651 RepID=UPI002605F4A9|nr:hypothetical protein [uncultured Tateyamaria sp.]
MLLIPEIEAVVICPADWTWKDGKPTCTAFRHALDGTGEPVTLRCLLTPDLFAEGIGC